MNTEPIKPFQSISHAFSDALLQVKVRPILYLLIWLFLSLAPYLLLGLLFSEPISTVMGDFVEQSRDLITTEESVSSIAPDISQSLFTLLGYSFLMWIAVFLCTVYYGAVLSRTVHRFRSKEIPVFVKVLKEGAMRYWGLFKVICVAIWKIFWKPAATLIAGMILSYSIQIPLFSSIGFIIALILVTQTLYLYGLAPFMHLHLEIQSMEAMEMSRQFFQGNRQTVTALFLWTIFLPILLMMLLTVFFISTGSYFGFGSIMLWILQSVMQFSIIMLLLNFTMNIEHDKEDLPASKPVE